MGSADESGSVTLIFYKLDSKWWREPFLNIVAAAAQFSKFTHVELAIGSDAGANGEMVNVCRVFNDVQGCELTARTGRNPQCAGLFRIQRPRMPSSTAAAPVRGDRVRPRASVHRYTYLQIGCSKAQELAMLRYARACVGKPFSGSAMARSIIFPRKTDGKSFFCAELVAAVLQHGGLIDRHSNPGAATPENLHQLYKTRATATANPYLLRQANVHAQITTASVIHRSGGAGGSGGSSGDVERRERRTDATNACMFTFKGLCEQRDARPAPRGASTSSSLAAAVLSPANSSRNAPTCGTVGGSNALHVIHAGQSASRQPVPLGLTLNSLSFG